MKTTMKLLIAASILALSSGCAFQNGRATGDSEAVYCITQADFPRDYGAAFQQAATEWNETVGSHITVHWDGACAERDIRVSVGDLPRSSDTAIAQEYSDKPSTIIITPGMTFHFARIVSMHEIGHHLGLPHSDSDKDVMFPCPSAEHLSDADVERYWAIRGEFEAPRSVP